MYVSVISHGVAPLGVASQSPHARPQVGDPI